MTVKLTSNFLKNARGLTFKDTASVTWALNANTNELSATGAGGGGSGTVTSVALADGSTSAIYAITGSPVSTSGTLTFTLKSQLQNLIFASPNGASGQPTFRSLVVADIPSGIAYSSLSGTPSIPVGANPSTAKVGLSAVNGSAATFMRSDAAPPLDQTISPTWTGVHTYTANAGGLSAGNVLSASQPTLTWQMTSGAADSKIWDLGAGATASDWQLRTINDAQSVAHLALDFARSGVALTTMTYGNTTDNPVHVFNSSMEVGAPTGGSEGTGTINVSSGYYVNGVRIGSGSGSGANVQIFQQSGGTSQTYNVPPGATVVRVICIGGGGGGASGSVVASGTATTGGGGGAGGGQSIWDFEASALGSSVTVSFSSTSGGTGGASKAASGGASGGNTGTAGATASFGVSPNQLLVAYGGGAGTGAGGGGTGGTGLQMAGTAGAAGVSGGAGGNGIAANTGSLSATGFPMCGGGAGGGISTTPAAFAGGIGGSTSGSTFMNLPSVLGGTSGGGTGGSGGSNIGGWGAGAGGGGGGSAISTTNGGPGGNGATFGAGGGGGGACLTTAASGSGKGGNGGSAAVICIAW